MMYSAEELQRRLNKEIEIRSSKLSSLKPAGLYEPVSYSLEEGGKRLRPLLLMMAYNLFADNVDAALPAAVGIEVFHNFTLLHDDIMDKAVVRRNKPTVHVKFNENKAILSGDAMAFLSYGYLMESQAHKLPEVIELFTRTALEVCEGQQFDMDFESSEDVTLAEYLEMIRLKTAVLLGCSLKSGALLAGADNDIAGKLYEMGISLGLAFQIQDDWLDSLGDSIVFGKRIGGDILSGKKTYLLIKALENADPETGQELKQWLSAGNDDAEGKISSIVAIYKRLGIDTIAKSKIMSLFDEAITILRELDVDESRKEQLYSLIHNMYKRSQ